MTVKEKIIHNYAIFSILFWIVSWSVWHFFDANLWYIGNANLIFSYSLYIYGKCTNKIGLFISSVFLFSAFNQLLDEFLFDPSSVDFNEYFIFIIFIIFTFWKTSRK